ncbi:MAG: NAD(P)-dependent glycerol-3-phosphate dehydrogenase [Candidatus Auribacter fodinae]|uniref:Glycerol-3-phosphate dehydrogenase [NAD(P)+] n=1 Tax=Candidatus Auribacter fodinae TaxID=2093366 RepID=A0A3A4R019_9BACT|nr:MAG: NAD(P)-dependent glycerol-3-phosphate dehydrogenase [Candidatus Auribacter fodinae]
MDRKTISVIGDGAWGTALALLLNDAGHKVTIWGAFPDYIDEVRITRKNDKYLPGVIIPDNITLTADESDCFDGCGLIVLATPSKFMRSICRRIKPFIRQARCNAPYMSVAKGIENDTLLRMSEVISQELETDNVAVLSGPTHAEEVARSIPSAVVAASNKPDLSEWIQSLFSTERFRVYSSSDLKGVELGGSLKNVIAIAAGICDGLGFGDNTKAALITRGLAEMTRLGVVMGADPFTFSGLSGMGDLIVTCASRHSRNRGLGEKIGSGMTLDEALQTTEKVAEGVYSAKSVHSLSRKLRIEMPISEKVYEVLYENRPCLDALSDLMMRIPKPEIDYV